MPVHWPTVGVSIDIRSRSPVSNGFFVYDLGSVVFRITPHTATAVKCVCQFRVRRGRLRNGFDRNRRRL